MYSRVVTSKFRIRGNSGVSGLEVETGDLGDPSEISRDEVP